MATQWDRDTKTGDYKQANGSPVNTDKLTLRAWHRIKIKQGKWLYAPDPSYGSLLHTVKKQTVDSAALEERLCVQACQPLVDEGSADRVTAQTIATQRGGSALMVTVVDEQNEPQDLVFTRIGV
jgi:phage gp46-like protein